MKRRPPGAAGADPVLHRVRVEFRKEGPARFLSHLDLQAAMERALRRARVPLAFSRGFHPRPRMVFEEALPLGWASERERCWVDLAEAWPTAELERRLRATLPAGLILLRAFPDPGRPRLPERRFFEVRWPEDGALQGLREALRELAEGDPPPVELLEEEPGRVVLAFRQGGRPSPRRFLLALGGEESLGRCRILRLADARPRPGESGQEDRP